VPPAKILASSVTIALNCLSVRSVFMRLTRLQGYDNALLVARRQVLKREIAMVTPSGAIVDESDAGVVAVEGAVVPRVLHGAEPCLAIESTVGARAIPARLKPIEDALAPLARIRTGMLSCTADQALVLGHVGLIQFFRSRVCVARTGSPYDAVVPVLPCSCAVGRTSRARSATTGAWSLPAAMPSS
jgi:hypothetical protein